MECIGCDRKFTTWGGMVIHLESGRCDSGLDMVDLNETAAMCYQWKKFMEQNYRDDLRECVPLHKKHHPNKIYPFKCPTCENTFSRLSGLFMHVASPSCGEDMSRGAMAKLMKWMENRHG